MVGTQFVRLGRLLCNTPFKTFGDLLLWWTYTCGVISYSGAGWYFIWTWWVLGTLAENFTPFLRIRLFWKTTDSLTRNPNDGVYYTCPRCYTRSWCQSRGLLGWGIHLQLHIICLMVVRHGWSTFCHPRAPAVQYALYDLWKSLVAIHFHVFLHM